MRIDADRRSDSVSTDVASDEELIARVRDGDDQALVDLLERYRRFARAKGRSYFLVGGDREDVIQEGMIGLYKAIRDYDPGYEASFRSFADLCITRQILSAVKAATRQKHTPLNAYVSLDRPESADSSRSVSETIVITDEEDPLRRIVEGDELDQLREIVDEVLSGLETKVLDLYVAGCSYQEIADSLGRQVKSVDNALQRVKRKLEQRLIERESLPA